MDLSTRVLGTGTVAKLTARETAAVLIIGKDRFTRGDLAFVKCFNFTAAQTLAAALATFTVKDTADLFARIPPSALALPHIGSIALAVLGAVFQVKGLGGAAPLEAWVEKHVTPAHQSVVTFTTIKAWAAAARRAPGRKHATHGQQQRPVPDPNAHRAPRRTAPRVAHRARPARRGRARQ